MNETDYAECKCTKCGSENIEWISRVTGYFSKISPHGGVGWNPGKMGELRDRRGRDAPFFGGKFIAKKEDGAGSGA